MRWKGRRQSSNIEDRRGMGGGGISIDPKIQLKKDSSGKLDQRRKEATSAKPSKGGFSN